MACIARRPVCGRAAAARDNPSHRDGSDQSYFRRGGPRGLARPASSCSLSPRLLPCVSHQRALTGWVNPPPPFLRPGLSRGSLGRRRLRGRDIYPIRDVSLPVCAQACERTGLRTLSPSHWYKGSVPLSQGRLLSVAWPVLCSRPAPCECEKDLCPLRTFELKPHPAV